MPWKVMATNPVGLSGCAAVDCLHDHAATAGGFWGCNRNLYGWIVSTYYAGISSFTLSSRLMRLRLPTMSMEALSNVFFGAVIAIIGCYQGLNAPEGAEGWERRRRARLLVQLL